MRFNGLALVAGAMAIVACSGGDKKADSTAATTNDTAAAPATTTTGDDHRHARQRRVAPITGTTHEVKMIGDGTTYKFDPANITIKQGDGIKFIMVSGGPHNVAFIDTAGSGAGAALGEHAEPDEGAHQPDDDDAERVLHHFVRESPAGHVRLPLRAARRDGNEGLDHGSVTPVAAGETKAEAHAPPPLSRSAPAPPCAPPAVARYSPLMPPASPGPDAAAQRARNGSTRARRMSSAVQCAWASSSLAISSPRCSRCRTSPSGATGSRHRGPHA